MGGGPNVEQSNFAERIIDVYTVFVYKLTNRLYVRTHKRELPGTK